LVEDDTTSAYLTNVQLLATLWGGIPLDAVLGIRVISIVGCTFYRM
jgi:hypothetical protein